MDRDRTYLRIEPTPHDLSLDEGFAAILRDPVWILAKQWLMGEHQAENASTPIRVDYKIRQSPLGEFKGTSPQTTPIEPALEGEPASWWTIGRRVRMGRLVAAAADLENRTNLPSGVRFVDPAPPYDQFEGQFDGQALWSMRTELGLDDVLFSPPPPKELSDSWQRENLFYSAEVDSELGQLTLPRHSGGQVDWFSAEGLTNTVPPSGNLEKRIAIPNQFQYPGAPADRWWTIENSHVDIGGYGPDPSRFPTLLLIDLISSHSVDWFQFPVPATVGQIISLREVYVTDSFDDLYLLTSPSHWSLFRTTGLDRDSLSIWPTAISPLQGPPIEEVLFQIDEYSNCLWAVERRIRCREVPTPEQSETTPISDASRTSRWEYRPVDGLARGWNPYVPVDVKDDEGKWRRLFVQATVVPAVQSSLGSRGPQANILRVGDDGERHFVHRIVPETIPSNGVVVERNYALARDTEGNPKLWVQRQRKPMMNPTTHQLRFDSLKEAQTASSSTRTEQ